MPFSLDAVYQFLNSPSFTLWQTVTLTYVGLLWLSIIIWVIRDSISRTNSLSFQIFAILLNIAIPLLGVVLYLIIRPGRTHIERYQEALEKQLFKEKNEEEAETCEECMAPLDKNFIYCPHCTKKVKKTCQGCQQHFSVLWTVCPFCGTAEKTKKPHKSPPEKGEKGGLKNKQKN